MAEPYAMVASRHHFRIWKSTATYNGQPLWAGAGTHDIGFEKDQRNGKVTPKIDPAVDGERDHIGESLQAGRSGEDDELLHAVRSGARVEKCNRRRVPLGWAGVPTRDWDVTAVWHTPTSLGGGAAHRGP